MRPFRLATVERLRSRQLETRAQELHAAGAELQQAVAERDRLIERLAAGAAASGPRSGADLDLANNFRQVLRQEIEDRAEQILHLDAAVGRARVAWLTARGELHAVQALHERHRLAVGAERARLDQRELDEHAGRPQPTEDEPTEAEPIDTEVGVR